MNLTYLNKSGNLLPKDAVNCMFAMCGSRVDELAREVKPPESSAINICCADILLDSEKQSDAIASQFKETGENILVCVPDTWAIPQLTVISLFNNSPDDIQFNITCENSGTRPDVGFTPAVSVAVSHYGKLMHIVLATGQIPNRTHR